MMGRVVLRRFYGGLLVASFASGFSRFLFVTPHIRLVAWLGVGPKLLKNPSLLSLPTAANPWPFLRLPPLFGIWPRAARPILHRFALFFLMSGRRVSSH